MPSAVRSRDCAKAFQRIAYPYGALDECATTLPMLQMAARMIAVKAPNIWLTSGDPTRRQAAVEFVLKGLESGSLKPVVERTFAFDDIADAHRYLETNGQFGKIVATV